MLTAFRKNAPNVGISSPGAVGSVFRTAGRALCMTTAVFALGFMAFAASGLANNRALGLLFGITIIIALVVDFQLPPTLLMAIDRRKK